MINQTPKLYLSLLILVCLIFLYLQTQQIPSTLLNIKQKYILDKAQNFQVLNNFVDFDQKNTPTQPITQPMHKKNLSFNKHKNTYLPVAEHSNDILLRIIVLTMNRAQSLKRLLHSLLDAEYYEDKIALDIWIDLPPFETNINVETTQIVTDFSWPYGPKTLHFRDTNAGLRRQWIESWNALLSLAV